MIIDAITVLETINFIKMCYAFFFFVGIPGYIIFESLLLYRAYRSGRFKIKSFEAMGNWLIVSIGMLLPYLYILLFSDVEHHPTNLLLFTPLIIGVIMPFIVRLDALKDHQPKKLDKLNRAAYSIHYLLFNVITAEVFMIIAPTIYSSGDILKRSAIVLLYSAQFIFNLGRGDKVMQEVRILIQSNVIQSAYYTMGFLNFKKESIYYKIRILMLTACFITFIITSISLISYSDMFIEKGLEKNFNELVLLGMVYNILYLSLLHLFKRSNVYNRALGDKASEFNGYNIDEVIRLKGKGPQ